MPDTDHSCSHGSVNLIARNCLLHFLYTVGTGKLIKNLLLAGTSVHNL